MTKQLPSGKVDKVEAVGDVQQEDGNWEVSDLATTSTTHLEDDTGEGKAAIIRMFEFEAKPYAFAIHTPSKQELFNTHLKGIEVMLWRDGLKIMTEVQPSLTINSKKTKYRIWVGAEPAKGHLLMERPQTLSEIANATTHG